MQQVMNPQLTPKYVQPSIDDKFPEGQKLNQPFLNEQGALVVREMGSRGQLTERVILKPSETNEGIRYATEAKQAEEMRKYIQKRRDDADKYAMDLETKTYKTFEGKEVATEEYYTLGQIELMRRRNFPDVVAAEKQEREAAQAEASQKVGEEEFYRRRQERIESFPYDTRHIDVNPEDADLPVEIQKAQGVLRKFEQLKKAGRDTSRMLLLIRTAKDILNDYKRSRE
jgi:hypothetical protein